MRQQRWVEVGRLDDIPRRGARRITGPPGMPAIAVFRTADDAVFALEDRCPHRGGPLSEGLVQGQAVACPLHGWLILLASGAAEAPDEGCTATVAARLVGDRIHLVLPASDADTRAAPTPSQTLPHQGGGLRTSPCNSSPAPSMGAGRGGGDAAPDRRSGQSAGRSAKSGRITVAAK